MLETIVGYILGIYVYGSNWFTLGLEWSDQARIDRSSFVAMDCLPKRPPGPVTKQIPRLDEAIASLQELQEEGEVEAATWQTGNLGLFCWEEMLTSSGP